MESVTHLSSVTDPEGAAEAVQAALSEVADSKEVKTISPPPQLDIELPAGFMDPQHGLTREAEVRELTGEDEEKLARVSAAKTLGKFKQTLLQCGVTSVGGRPATKDVLDALLVGDREYLLLQIRRATYGDEMEMSLRCPNCAADHEVIYQLDVDVPINHLENEEDRFFTVDLKAGKAVVAFPSGADETKILDDSGKKTMAEINTYLLSRCIESINDMPIGEADVRRLGMKDRRVLIEELQERQPGPRYDRVQFECPDCGRSSPVNLDLADLFRPM